MHDMEIFYKNIEKKCSCKDISIRRTANILISTCSGAMQGFSRREQDFFLSHSNVSSESSVDLNINLLFKRSLRP